MFTETAVRQTDSLVRAVHRVGAPAYRLVRTTPYVAANVKIGTQGTRILYDTTRYTLVSHCSDKTGNHRYSRSCTIRLPLRAHDPETERR